MMSIKEEDFHAQSTENIFNKNIEENIPNLEKEIPVHV